MRGHRRSLGSLAAVALLALAGAAVLPLPVLAAVSDIDARSRKAVNAFVELGKLCKRHGRSYLDLVGQLDKLEEGRLADKAAEALAEREAAEACLREAKKKDELVKRLYGDYQSVLTQASSEGSSEGARPRDPVKVLSEVFRKACSVPADLIGTVDLVAPGDSTVQRHFGGHARGSASAMPVELVELTRASERVFISSGFTTEIVKVGNTAPVRVCR